MIRKRPGLLLLAFLAAAGCSPGGGDAPDSALSADRVLINGRVYTLAWDDPAPDGAPAADAPVTAEGWHPDAEALAMRGGEIVYVGDAEGALALAGDRTVVMDLGGATVLPGLADSHTHIFELGAKLFRVDLYDVADEAEAVELVAARARMTPPGEWIIGQGWDEGAWADRYPDKGLLSAAVPDHPVVLKSLHGFAVWTNQKALDLAGIDADTPVPSGGEIRVGEDGQPNGLFLNRATRLLDDAIPEPGDEQLAREVLKGLRQMAEDGYVVVHDAGLGAREMRILQSLEDEGRLPIRVYAMLSARDEPLMREWIERGPDADADSMLVTRAVKAYYDGALGSRGARLIEDYWDMPGHRGVSGGEYGFDEALVAEAMAAGFQAGIHAIGDAGNREVLDYFERVFSEFPASASGRHRIEHAQVLHPDDLPRLAELGIIASMEPPHAVEDKTWAEDRLGPDRIRGAYAWRSLRESGAKLTFNSDNPGSDHSIFYGLHAAVTRRDKSLDPEGGWYPGEAVTLDEALRAYTRWAAFASFREGETGTIEPGKWADLTVMDIDPFQVAGASPRGLLDGRILMTVVGGRVVYEHLED